MSNPHSPKSNIRELDLSHKQLQSFIQVTDSVKTLNLSHNKIALIEGVSNKNNLSNLDLSHNRLISIEGISNLNSLRVLDIGYNFLSPSQLAHLKFMKRLKVLNVCHNHFAGNEALNYLNELTQVQELNLSFNDFSSWSFSNPMLNLKRLVLDNNKLKTLNLQNVPNLQALSCNENSISEIYGLSSLNELTELFVDSNELCELPPLPSVHILSASQNKLSSISTYPSLQMLNVSFNLLNQVPKFSNHLTQLIVASNCLTSLPFGMKNLEVLEASNNKLNNLEFLSTCDKLTIIRVAFNEFPSFEAILPKVAHCPLTDADFSGLQISEVEFRRCLRSFPYLEKWNDKMISDDDRAVAGYSEESSFNDIKNIEEVIEQFKSTKKLEIPEIRKEIRIKIDPNSSSEIEKPAKSSLSEFNSPRSVCLTPSHTETLSVIPMVSSPQVYPSEVNSSEVPYKMKEMYKSIVSSMKKNISKQLFDYAKDNQITSRPRHHHHHCCHHKCRKLKNPDLKSDIEETKPTPTTTDQATASKTKAEKIHKGINTSQISSSSRVSKISKISQIHQLENQKFEKDLTDEDFRVSFSPIPQVQAKKIEDYYIKGIIKYCKTPPRPILKHEKKSTITNELNENSQEFLVVTSFFSHFQVKVWKIVKSFLFEAVFNNSFDNIAFFYPEPEEAMQVIKDVSGFLTRKVNVVEKVRVNSSCCVICAVRMDGVISIGSGQLQSNKDGTVVPAYVVWYNS